MAEWVFTLESASAELLERVRLHGRTIVTATPGTEELRYLDHVGAEANVGGPQLTHIIVRPSPSKVALLEEFLHGTQWKLGIVQRLGVVEAEAHVKRFMIRHGRLLGLSKADVTVLVMLIVSGRNTMDSSE